MAIRDTISNNSEEHAKVMAALMKAKAALHFDEVLKLIQNNWNPSLWERIVVSAIPNEEIDASTIEHYLKLRFHQLDIFKKNGENVAQDQSQLLKLMEDFTSIHPELYYFEIEEMKKHLGTAFS